MCVWLCRSGSIEAGDCCGRGNSHPGTVPNPFRGGRSDSSVWRLKLHWRQSQTKRWNLSCLICFHTPGTSCLCFCVLLVPQTVSGCWMLCCSILLTVWLLPASATPTAEWRLLQVQSGHCPRDWKVRETPAQLLLHNISLRKQNLIGNTSFSFSLQSDKFDIFENSFTETVYFFYKMPRLNWIMVVIFEVLFAKFQLMQ